MTTTYAVLSEGLEKRFGAVHALRGLDLAVAEGTVCGLLGPNGAGKTTAVRLLTTLLRPDAGSARVAGHDLVREAAAVRRRIGVTGQYASVDGDLTGRQNLRLFARLHRVRDTAARAGELLDRFGLTEAADRPAATLSGGLRRRLDLAASLVRRPDVLFLDEPTTGLDPAGRNRIWEAVRLLKEEGTTVLLTTQYLEEADRLADDIVLVDRGRVAHTGSPAALKALVGRTPRRSSPARTRCRWRLRCWTGSRGRSPCWTTSGTPSAPSAPTRPSPCPAWCANWTRRACRCWTRVCARPPSTTSSSV